MSDAMEYIMRAFGLVAFAGAVYGGIRADLRAMSERITAASDSATRAHTRLDNLLEQRRTK